MSNRKSMIQKATALASDVCEIMADGKCCRCGRKGGKAEGFCAHHIIRKGMGGGNYKTRFTPYNLLWVCTPCHTGNTNSFHNIAREDELEWIKMHEPSHYAFISDPANRSLLIGNPDTYLDYTITYLTSLKEYINEQKRIR